MGSLIWFIAGGIIGGAFIGFGYAPFKVYKTLKDNVGTTVTVQGLDDDYFSVTIEEIKTKE